MAEGIDELGRRVAQRFIVRDSRPGARNLAGKMGVEIVEREEAPPAQRGLRSEYQADPPRITLYRGPLDRLAARIHISQRFDMMNCDLDEVHIAHELFHHVEARGRFGEMGAKEVERAAHAFAQELLDLTFNPAELSQVT